MKIILYITCLLLIVFYYKKSFDVKKYQELITKNSKIFNVPESLIYAVIKVESKFKANIRGRTGEYGLMQLMPGVLKDWNRIKKQKISYEDLFLPEVNIRLGTWYLSKALRTWKDYLQKDVLSLAQYNAGPAKVRDWVPKNYNDSVLPHISYPTTKQYIQKVLIYKESYMK